MAPKKCFRTFDAIALLLAVCALIASWVVFERPYGTAGKIAAGIGPYIGILVALGIGVMAAFKRKALRSSNYPRIEHLRIAGKYQAVGASANMSGKEYHWSMGSSPLHLRR